VDARDGRPLGSVEKEVTTGEVTADPDDLLRELALGKLLLAPK